MSLPSYAAIAETLAVRYPHDVDGVLHLGRATLADNRPADAMRILERVVAADSVIARDDLLPCSSCEALEMIVHAYQAMDSLSAAIRTIDRWTRLKPRSRAAWQARAAFLTLLGRDAEATEAFERYSTVADVPDAGQLLLAQLHIMGDRFDEADRVLVPLAAAGAPAQRGEAYWFLTLSLRNQGRLEEALEAARAYRRTAPLPDGGHASTLLNAAGEGQVLFESRRYREATALFDSISRLAMPTTLGETARGRVWWLTHAADAFAAQGDTLPLRWIADTVEARGPGSNFHRDRRLHFHVRGLLYAARGHYEDAATQFERARSSPGAGYTRTNYELARLYLRLGRPRDAVTTLQPVLRAGLEGSSYYLTRTETHELLGRSWDAVGDSAARDSAAAHYRRVVQAWSHGDSAFAARANAAAARLAALGR
jgi:tetratricopeptide (TPR) repeat protein